MKPTGRFPPEAEIHRRMGNGMLAGLRRSISSVREYLSLPAAARRERRADRRPPVRDPGTEIAIREGVDWLCRAQDRSASQDGGVARDFSLIKGWAASYPETTGYIIPTLFDLAERYPDKRLRERATRMLDWLVSIQLEDGGFQGGVIGQTPVVTVTFNTGQILIGLARGVQELGSHYLQPMRRAADQLVESQDEDGCWRSHPTPFSQPGEKTYETHVAWGLFEAARVEPEAERAERYEAAAVANIEWALSHQHLNGWFARCCLFDPSAPLTHTLGYVLRGVLEAYRYTDEPRYIAAARATADGLLTALRPDGSLPGRLDSRWSGTVPWQCLTGIAQIAHCWLMLYEDTGTGAYRDAAYAANAYVRRTVRVDESAGDGVRGGVKGAFPVQGNYLPYQYINWACKFLVDSCALEERVRAAEAADRSGTRSPALK